MLKLLFILSLLLLITGCGHRTLEGEALERARVAIESGDYDRGSLALLIGCEDLHAQSVYLVHMARYLASNDLMEMVHAWIAIDNIDTTEYFIQEEAYRLLNATLRRAVVSNE